MFTSGCNYGKLKTNLRLSISRLKLIQKKKTEMTQKSRKEIADHLAAGKPERAKIRVEHIIREDYLIESMELVEMYCDLLLARFGLIQQMKTLDEGLAEAISSLIWVAPRLQTDIPELKIVAEQLTYKYGNVYAQAVRAEQLETMNKKLMHRMGVEAPPKILVEKYLIEIAKSHDVPYEPDQAVLDAAEGDFMPTGELINLNDGLGPTPPGFVIPPAMKGDAPRQQPMYVPPANGGYPQGAFPPQQYGPPAGYMPQYQPQQPGYPYPPGPSYQQQTDQSAGATKGDTVPPPLPMAPPNAGKQEEGENPNPSSSFQVFAPSEDNPPRYDSVMNARGGNMPFVALTPSANGAPQATSGNVSDDILPNLPDVPSDGFSPKKKGGGGGGGSNQDDPDFDDLTRRFENLKKKK